MMRRHFAMILTSLAAVAAWSETPTPAPTAAVVQEPAVATFGGQAITVSQLEAAAAPRLLKVRNEEYTVKSALARDLAYERLRAAAASKLEITVEELYARNVTQKAGEPTKPEVDDLITRYRAQLPPDDAKAREEVTRFLKEQRVRNSEQAWRRELLTGAGFKLLLDPPRVAIPVTAADPSRGPATAPVTVVEFSDFQCPYCGRVQPSIERLRQTYGDKLRMVFKQLPLAMHQQAPFAANAALCAGQQAKFWEMHDWLFANQTRIAPEAVKAAAPELKLDVDAFGKCLDAKVFAGKVDEDARLAESLGITGTPAFLINGRFLEGAQPFEAFQEVVDEELARLAVAATN